MKSFFAKFAVVSAVVSVMATGLGGCQPASKVMTDDEGRALNDEGYLRSPRITAITQVGLSTFELSGLATPDGRVLSIFSGRNTAGQALSTKNGNPVDSKGRFKVQMPFGALGGIYDLQMDDTGRQLHAEGRLFVPQDHAEKAVLLRPGAASLPLSSEKNVMAVVDYDAGGGLAVAGKVEAGVEVNLIQGDVIIGRAQSDDTGRYHLTSQIPVPTATPVQIDLIIEAGSDRAERRIAVSVPATSDQISRLSDGWRVDWIMPGGGSQTALVF